MALDRKSEAYHKKVNQKVLVGIHFGELITIVFKTNLGSKTTDLNVYGFRRTIADKSY